MILSNFRYTDTDKISNDNIIIGNNEIISIGNFILNKDDQVFDCKNYYLIPGFVDLQTYGAGGIIFESDLTVEALANIGLQHLHHGTTSFLITIPTTSLENIFKAIEVVRDAMTRNVTGLIGLHLEGPFINPDKKGAHNSKHLLEPSKEIIEKIIEKGAGIIKMMTIAPELFSADLLDQLLASEILISAGHSNANYADSKLFFDQGITCSTHLFNAMSQLESRAAGLTGAVLLNEKVWSTIVVDGKHVCYETLNIAFKLKQQKLILISDSTFLDVQDAIVSIGGIDVYKNGNEFYTIDGRLAGSSISLLDAIRNTYKHLNTSLSNAIEMATGRPARLIQATFGRICIGAKANMILIDEEVNLKGVIYEGEWIMPIV